MILNTKNFTTLVQQQAIAIQTKTAALIDFTVGSILRSVIESTASVVLWLEALILQVMALTRATTSTGADVDTFFFDFNFFRLGANAATGLVAFSRFTPTLQAVVPIGATMQTADGTQSFTVILDTSNSNYSAPLNGYVLAPGITSISCLVRAVVPSTASNVLANTITVLTSPISGVDFINNAGAFSGGSSPETDAAFRARFWLYVAALRAGTKGAVGYAVASMQVGAAYTLTENFTLGGVYTPGFFYVVVDDGTGNPPASMVTNAYTAIDAIRPVTTTFATFPPVIVTANVAMLITTAPGYVHNTVAGIVGQAITTYINTLPLGATLPYSVLARIAYDASPGVTNVTGVTLNSAALDLVQTPQQVAKLGTLSVT